MRAAPKNDTHEGKGRSDIKIAIISGASSGIGREFAHALAKKEGIDELWLVSRRMERLSELAEALSPHVSCRIFALDLTQAGALAPLRAALDEREHKVDWLVAAAGVGKMGDFAVIGEAEHREMIALNCAALTGLIDVALPCMREGSHILTLASAAAFLPQPHFAVYAATKAYVLQLSRALARELRPRGILVTAVCPGPVDTAFLEAASLHAAMPKAKRAYLIKPGQVVRAAMRGAQRGHTVVTPTCAMKIARIAAKILPHGLLIRFFR